MEAASFAQTNLPFRSPSSASRTGNVLTQNRSISTSKLSFQPELRYIRATSERPHQINYSRFNQQDGSHPPHGLSSGKSALNVALTDVLELEPAVEVNKAENKNNVLEDEEAIKEHHLHLTLNTGFEAPEINAFGHSFRDYEKESVRQSTVEQFYKTQHINQTYEFAVKKKEDYAQLNKAEMSIWECCELLNEFIDESDPDLDEPQIEHLLQSAEAIRRDYPKEDWLHLTALIHDLGKVLLHPSFGAQPQWCVVGDTFPLGCEFHKSVVHHKYFQENPDFHNPIFNTKLGIYSENCGLDKVTMSWGHDEYMYLVAKGNKTTLPPAALFIIRFHSFYALHRSNAYTYFMNDEDKEMLKWLKVFNKYDLYSKSKVRINQEEVKPYYLSLIRKYFPTKLRW